MMFNVDSGNDIIKFNVFFEKNIGENCFVLSF